MRARKQAKIYGKCRAFKRQREQQQQQQQQQQQ
jgi:hypothetical protein